MKIDNNSFQEMKSGRNKNAIFALSNSEFFDKRLWCGFSHISLQKLHQISKTANRFERSRALWYLARWYYSHGRVEYAKELLLKRKAIISGWDNKNLFGLIKCNSLLGDYEEIIPAIIDFEINNKLDIRGAYLKANGICGLKGKDEERIEYINQIFKAKDLLPVRKRYSKKGLSIDNLSWSRRKYKRNSAYSNVKLPLVSVIIPAFNAGDTIHIAINSLLDQTWKNIEIIIVDDCSHDNTVEVVKRLSKKHPQILLIQNETNMGAYPTRNSGVSKASGEFITIHDGDDWSHPQKIELQMDELLKNENIIASISYWVRVKEDLRFVGSWMLNHTFVELNHSSLLIRRSAIESCGRWDGVKFGADTEFFWRITKFYGDDAIVKVLPDTPLSFALALDSSLTRTKLTHVKTINYGVRRLYRESAMWWHKQSDKPYLNIENRPFQGPLGIFRNSCDKFDIVIITDFSSQNEHLSSALIHAEKAIKAGLFKICFLHWPDFNKTFNTAIDDTVFGFCQKYAVQFTHYGLTINAKDVILYGSHLLEYIPDSLPIINNIENVFVFDRNKEIVEPSINKIVRKYLSKGGSFDDTIIDKLISNELSQDYFEVGLPESLSHRWAKNTIHYGAADRIRHHLSYRIGNIAIVKCNSIKNFFSLPFAFRREYINYCKDRERLRYINKLPPIDKYLDKIEAEKVRKQLSYRIGTKLIKYGRNPFLWFWLPFSISIEIVRFRESRNASALKLT